MTDGGTLAKLTQVEKLLIEASSLSDIIQVRDMAKAAQEYARAAKLGMVNQNHAAEIRLKAERKAGRFLSQIPKQKPGEYKRLHDATVTPALSDLGISKTQSSRWQAIAAVSEQKFIREIAKLKASNTEITSSRFIKLGRQVKAAQKQKLADEIESTTNNGRAIQVSPGDVWQLGKHRLYCCDSSQWRPKRKAQMAFADPPYNHGVAAWDIDFKWQHDWLQDFASYVFVTPGIANHARFFGLTSMSYRWTYVHWLCNAIAPPNDWGMSNQVHALLFSALKSLKLEKHSDHHKASVSPLENQATKHPGRKPASLLVWLIGITTKAGGLVIDPFLGSGTTLLAAEKTGRVCHGAEIDPRYCQEIIGRWQGMTKKTAKRLN